MQYLYLVGYFCCPLLLRDQTVQTDQITDLNRFYPSVLKATEKNPRLFLTKDCSHDRNGYDSHHLICHFITQP